VPLASMGFYRANISFSTAALAIDFYRVRGLDKPHAQTREVKKFSGINLALSAFLSALAPHAPQPLGLHWLACGVITLHAAHGRAIESRYGLFHFPR
jgi:hypothetical protein